MIEDRATDHLTAIEPAESVLEICEKLGQLNLSHTTRLELRAFRETRTPHDGRRLINALRYVENVHDVAREVEKLLEAKP